MDVIIKLINQFFYDLNQSRMSCIISHLGHFHTGDSCHVSTLFAKEYTKK